MYQNTWPVRPEGRLGFSDASGTLRFSADPTANETGAIPAPSQVETSNGSILRAKRDSFVRLTDFTDYTLRALMYLAIRDDRLATIEEIAEKYEISKHHMSKIIQRLSAVGWIETVRGRHGGVRLAQHTRSLTVGAIVRETEQDFVLASCQASDGRGHCSIVQYCRLKDILYAAREAFLADLDSCTLAELATPTASLAQAFGLFWFGVVAPLDHDTNRKQETGK